MQYLVEKGDRDTMVFMANLRRKGRLARGKILIVSCGVLMFMLLVGAWRGIYIYMEIKESKKCKYKYF